MNLADQLRIDCAKHMRKNKWMKKNGSQFKDELLKLLGNDFTRNTIYSAGNNLSDLIKIGKSLDTEERSMSQQQSDKSTVGNAWEVITCLFLNLCFTGTETVALTKAFIPKCIKSAFKMTHEASSKAIETDLDCVILSNKRIKSEYVKSNPVKELNDVITAEHSFRDTAFVFIACKSNWNDQLARPTYENLVYRTVAKMGTIEGVVMGDHNHNPHMLASYDSAFITVPTNKKALTWKSDNVPVKRTGTFTLGGFWGLETRNGTSRSLSEFAHVAASKITTIDHPPPLSDEDHTCVLNQINALTE